MVAPLTAPALDCLPHLTAAALGCGADSKAPALVSGVQAPALPVSATANVLRNVLRNVLGDVLRIPYFGFRTSDSVLRIPYVVSGRTSERTSRRTSVFFVTYLVRMPYVHLAQVQSRQRRQQNSMTAAETPAFHCRKLRYRLALACGTAVEVLRLLPRCVVAAEVRRCGCLLLLLLLLLLWCCHHQ